MSLRRSLSGALLALSVAVSVPIGADAQTPALDSLLSASALDQRLLEQAVLERNPSLGAMRAAWRGGEAAADQAGALEDPMLEVMTAPQSWSSSNVDHAYMASISQVLPLFGPRGPRGRAARAGARAMGEDYRGARLDILREARRAYYEYFLASRGRAVNAEVKDLLGQVRRTAVGRYSAGTVGLEDALQADVEIAMLDHEDVALMRERRVASVRLNALLQRDPGSRLPEAPVEITLAPSPERSDSLLALARALRPEIKMWAARGESKASELSLARRQRLPELTFTARYDRFMEERQWRPQVGLSMNLPIQFGRLGAAERAARAGVEQMGLRRSAAETQVAAEVETSLATVQETEHEIHVIQHQLIPTAERALRTVRASYENSRASFSAVLNAERDLARARFDLYRAQVGYLQAFADLDRAVGTAPAEQETR